MRRLVLAILATASLSRAAVDPPHAMRQTWHSDTFANLLAESGAWPGYSAVVDNDGTSHPRQYWAFPLSSFVCSAPHCGNSLTVQWVDDYTIYNSFVTTIAWSNVTNTPTTLNGYGITDAVAKTLQIIVSGGGLTVNGSTSTTLAGNVTFAVDWGAGTNQIRHGDDAAYTNDRTSCVWRDATGTVTGCTSAAPVAGYVPTATDATHWQWQAIPSVPLVSNTVNGIVPAITGANLPLVSNGTGTSASFTQVGNAGISAVDWTKITNKPSSVAGYGISDAVTTARAVTTSGGLTVNGSTSDTLAHDVALAIVCAGDATHPACGNDPRFTNDRIAYAFRDSTGIVDCSTSPAPGVGYVPMAIDSTHCTWQAIPGVSYGTSVASLVYGGSGVVGVSGLVSRADHVHPLALLTNAGVAPAADIAETKLAPCGSYQFVGDVGSGTNCVVFNDTWHGVRGGGGLHAVATTSVSGFESAADKTNINNLIAAKLITYGDYTTNLPGSAAIVVNPSGNSGLVLNQPSSAQVGLAAPFGTIAGTYAQGNDSRIVNALSGSLTPGVIPYTSGANVLADSPLARNSSTDILLAGIGHIGSPFVSGCSFRHVALGTSQCDGTNWQTPGVGTNAIELITTSVNGIEFFTAASISAGNRTTSDSDMNTYLRRVRINDSGVSVNGSVVATGPLQSTTPNFVRGIQGNYGVFLRNDGVTSAIQITNSGDPQGGGATFPFTANNATGNVGIKVNPTSDALTVNGTFLTTDVATINGVRIGGTAIFPVPTTGTPGNFTVEAGSTSGSGTPANLSLNSGVNGSGAYGSIGVGYADHPAAFGSIGSSGWIVNNGLDVTGTTRLRGGAPASGLVATSQDSSGTVLWSDPLVHIYNTGGVRYWDSSIVWYGVGPLNGGGASSIFIDCSKWSGCDDGFQFDTRFPFGFVEVEIVSGSGSSGGFGCRQRFYGDVAWSPNGPGWFVDQALAENTTERALPCAHDFISASYTMLAYHTLQISFTWPHDGMVTARVRLLGSGIHP